MRNILFAPSILALLLVAGCAGVATVPGGSETINAAYFDSSNDFQSRVESLSPGMGESQVLAVLGRSRNDMTRLSRDEIVRALYGGATVQMLDTSAEREATRKFLDGLDGYRLEYKNVENHHGFASPIRIRTQKEGYDYTVNMIYQNGVLMEKPVLSGGIVNDTTSKTFFDYLNPGTLISQAN